MPTDAPDPKDLVATFRTQIEQSDELIDRYKPTWQRSVQAYLGQTLDAEPKQDTVVVPVEYAFVEQKKAMLFFQVPELVITPTHPQWAPVTPLIGQVLNYELGPHGANVDQLLEDAKFSVLTCGIAPSKIGYRSVIEQVPTEQPIADDLGQPILDPATGQPQTETLLQPKLVWERYVWEPFSPHKLLLPADFTGTDFDGAPWLGLKFEMDLTAAKAKWQDRLPDDYKGGVPDDELLTGSRAVSTTRKVLKGIEIWYKAHLFQPEITNPEVIHRIVLAEGIDDQPLEGPDAPYQDVTPDGKVIGMKGFPIHPLVIRTVVGAPYPPSDVAMTRALAEELSRFRSQMVQQRELNQPMNWFDKNAVDPDTMSKIVSGEVGDGDVPQRWVPVDGEGSRVLGQVVRATIPRENFTANDIIDRDIQRVWAMSVTQQAVKDEGTPTATEVQAQRFATDVRLDAERARMLKWYVAGAKKFFSLLQLFADETKYIPLTGGQEAQNWQQWDRQTIAGEFLFDAKPDSQLRVDVVQERQQALHLYDLMGRDPNVNRLEFLKKVLTLFRLDPSKLVVEETPEQGPEPPKISFAVKAEDLDPRLPHFAIIVDVLAKAGIQIDPKAIENAGLAAGAPGAPAPGGNGDQPGGPEAEHPGSALKADRISQHVLDTPGTGRGMRKM